MPARLRTALVGLVALLTTAATVAAAAPSAATAPAAPGEQRPGWTVRPAPGDGSRPYAYAEGAPGAVLEDRLTVTNPGTAPLTVRLRPADEPEPNPARGAAKGVGRWIALAATAVTVPPRTRADVPYTLTVPADAAPGDHPAAVLATVVDDAEEHPAQPTALRIRLRVTGPALAALAVEGLAAEGGTLRYTLVNRGNTVLEPRVHLTADGLLGTAFRRAARGVPAELRPGQRVAVSETWRGAPALDRVDLRVSATAAGDARAAAAVTVTFVPWGRLAIAVLLAAALALLARRAVRHRRGRAGPVPSAPHPGTERHPTRAGT
ncbi:COG1470 family protein [Streptomyces sp. NPDC003860]